MLNMRYSKNGLHLTEGFEQCRLVAYRDIRGIWTIGWGHTGPDVYEGLVWTQAQADAMLMHDVHNAEMMVNYAVRVPLTQDEFDALVDFCFNVGGSNFAHSTLVKLLNAGEYQAAVVQLERWDYAGGKHVAGLLRRRLAEEKEFNTPDEATV